MFTPAERPIFIVGAQRSGTTLLRYMLSSHPRLYIPPESNFIPRFFQKQPCTPMSRQQAIQIAGMLLAYRPFFRDWHGERLAPETFVNSLPDLTPAAFVDTLYTHYARQHDAQRWGDKSPIYTEHIDLLAEIFPTAQFIHIIRDGRDTALSMQKAYQGKRFFYVDLYYAGRTWKRRVNKARAAGYLLGADRYYELHYEHLVANPDTLLSEICDFLGEAYAPTMVAPDAVAGQQHHSTGIHANVRQAPTTKSVGRWQQEMSFADQRLFQSVAGDLLQELAYNQNKGLGRMPVVERLRYIRLWAKYAIIESGRRFLQVVGVFHPARLLAPRPRREASAVPALTHCMIVHAYYPLGETRVERQATALVKNGFAVDVICLRAEGEPAIDRIDGINIYRLPVKRHKGRGLVVQLLEYLAFFSLAGAKLAALHRRRPYHAVQVHNLPDFLVFAAWRPKMGGARVILDLHDLMPEFYAGRFQRSLASWPVRLVLWQERLSCRFADHVITVSEHWRNTLIQRGVPARKCSVVMNVADDAIFYCFRTENLESHAPARAVENGTLRLIYHGTLVRRYGLDLAIQAVDKVKDDIPGIHLTILGDGDDAPELMRMVDELNLQQHVTIYNELRPTQELPAIIRSADLGIVPYRNDTFTDGLLPTKLMEYAALGLPAIAARTKAIETTFGDTMVELFEPGNATDLVRCIGALYKSPDRLAKLAQGSIRFNERHNWTKVGAEYVALVRAL
jgi:glycosyltransferase involved in cell wall biosynthesis